MLSGETSANVAGESLEQTAVVSSALSTWATMKEERKRRTMMQWWHSHLPVGTAPGSRRAVRLG